MPTGAKEPALGTIKIEGDTAVAVDDRVVRLDLSITEYNFKTLAPNIVKSLVSDVQALPQHERVLDLDRLLAYTANSPLKVKETEGIKADPPLVFSAPAPAMLINLDGDPIWSPIKDVDLRYALNTNWDLFEHQPTKTFYVRSNASWLQAPSVIGPWTAVTGKLPDSFSKLPADDNWKDVKAALPGQKLNAKTTPKVFVSTVPAELILLEGPISYVSVPGATSLLWVNNTEADVFRMSREGAFYFLVAGRWFSAPSLDGPLDLCHAEAAGGLQEDPDRASALARAGVGSGHAAGHRGRGAGHHSADRAGEQEAAEGPRRGLFRRPAVHQHRGRQGASPGP